MSDKSFLKEWQARIGVEEASKITNKAARRGTAVHGLLERYVLNQEIDLRKEIPFEVELFKQVQTILSPNINDILCSEGMLYSHKLKVAGSVDLVCNWKGKPAIVDFKTSLKTKRKDWITNYFLQTAMYAYMFWEMTGILCADLIVVIAIENSNYAQVFEEKTISWLPDVFTMCKEYHKRFG